MTDLRRHSFDPAPQGRGLSRPLSQEGVQRREHFLGELHAELDRRTARRRTNRTAGAALACAVALATAWAFIPTTPGSGAPAPAPIVKADPPKAPAIPAPIAPTPEAATPPASVITIVATDPGIVQRLAVATASPSIEIMSDDALQRELAAAGIDPGLVTINGRTMIALAPQSTESTGRQPR